jgi:hypothetical protein
MYCMPSTLAPCLSISPKSAIIRHDAERSPLTCKKLGHAISRSKLFLALTCPSLYLVSISLVCMRQFVFLFCVFFRQKMCFYHQKASFFSLYYEIGAYPIHSFMLFLSLSLCVSLVLVWYIHILSLTFKRYFVSNVDSLHICINIILFHPHSYIYVNNILLDNSIALFIGFASDLISLSVS